MLLDLAEVETIIEAQVEGAVPEELKQTIIKQFL